MEVWKMMKKIVEDTARNQGIKQGFLAGKCGFDEKTFSAIINGKRANVTCAEVEKFCVGMGVTPNDLFGFSTNEIYRDVS